jgi:hypothetical protein
MYYLNKCQIAETPFNLTSYPGTMPPIYLMGNATLIARMSTPGL